MKKYVLEVGGPSMYVGTSIESRTLYSTYEAAKKAFDNILKKNYTEEELTDENVIDACKDNCNPEANYLDDWTDDENDVYLCIYEVKEEE